MKSIRLIPKRYKVTFLYLFVKNLKKNSYTQIVESTNVLVDDLCAANKYLHVVFTNAYMWYSQIPTCICLNRPTRNLENYQLGHR